MTLTFVYRGRIMVMSTIALRAQYLQNSWRCCLATIA